MGHRQGNPYTLWIILAKLSKTETNFIHFCQIQKNGPILKLENTELPIVEQCKFLGIIFDLSFIPPI